MPYDAALDEHPRYSRSSGYFVSELCLDRLLYLFDDVQGSHSVSRVC